MTYRADTRPVRQSEKPPPPRPPPPLSPPPAARSTRRAESSTRHPDNKPAHGSRNRPAPRSRHTCDTAGADRSRPPRVPSPLCVPPGARCSASSASYSPKAAPARGANRAVPYCETGSAHPKNAIRRRANPPSPPPPMDRPAPPPHPAHPCPAAHPGQSSQRLPSAFCPAHANRPTPAGAAPHHSNPAAAPSAHTTHSGAPQTPSPGSPASAPAPRRQPVPPHRARHKAAPATPCAP